MKNFIVKCIHYTTKNAYDKDACMSPYDCVDYLFQGKYPILGIECIKGVVKVDWIIFITKRKHFEKEFQIIEEE